MSTTSARPHCQRACHHGVTLIELIMFILVVGIAVTGLLLVYTNTVRHSSDPLVRKQMLSVAEALLEEFDNVNDDAGFDSATALPPGIHDTSGSVIAIPRGYRAQVAAVAKSLGPAGSAIAANDSNGGSQVLLVTVTVTAPDGDSLSLSGYRTRYAPNAMP